MPGPAAALLLSLLAAEPRWGLTFKSADGCLSPAELAEAIEKRLGRATFGARPDLVIDGYLKPDGPKAWRARLTLVDSQGAVKGSREVTGRGSSCHTIDEALALVAAVMIDPAAALKGAPRNEPAPPAVLESQPQSQPTPDPEPPPRLEGPKAPPRDAWPGYLTIEQGSFTQDRQWISRTRFYRVVGRPELGDAFENRVTARAITYALGTLVLTSGMALSLAQPFNPGCSSSCAQAPVWPIASGLVGLGVGALAIILASVLPVVPTSEQQDVELADAYNAQLTPPALPVTASR